MRRYGRRWCALAVCVLGLLASALPLHAAGPDEPLGWRVGPAAWTFNRFTFFEAVDKTAALGLHYIEAFEGQRISKEIGEPMGPALPDSVLEQVRSKLKASGVRLTSVYVHNLPGDEPAARKIFEFCRKLGVETIVSEPAPEALNVLERLCDEYGVKLAIHNHPRGSSRYWNPQEVLKVCAGRSPRIGACADTGHWQRSGIKPVDGVRLLGPRLLSLNVKDLNELGPEGHDVPWGTGKGEMAEMLREIHRLGCPTDHFRHRVRVQLGQQRLRRRSFAPVFSADSRRHRRLGNREGAAAPGRLGDGGYHASGADRAGRATSISGSRRACATRSPQPFWPWRGGANGREQAVLVSRDWSPARTPSSNVSSRRCTPGARPGRQQAVHQRHAHAHRAGLLDEKFKGLYDVSKDPGLMKASEYAEIFLDHVSKAVAQAWQGRKPGSVSWAVSQAVVGYNRRAHYANGTTVMYGDTTKPEFLSVEAGEDHSVDVLCFRGPGRKLAGLVVNVACPSQETGAPLRGLGRFLARGAEPSFTAATDRISSSFRKCASAGRPVAAPALPQEG